MALIGFAIVPKKPKEKSEMAAPTRTGRFVHITIKAVNSGKYLSVTAIQRRVRSPRQRMDSRRPASPVVRQTPNRFRCRLEPNNEVGRGDRTVKELLNFPPSGGGGQTKTTHCRTLTVRNPNIPGCSASGNVLICLVQVAGSQGPRPSQRLNSTWTQGRGHLTSFPLPLLFFFLILAFRILHPFVGCLKLLGPQAFPVAMTHGVRYSQLSARRTSICARSGPG